jgi:hypothetical protein
MMKLLRLLFLAAVLVSFSGKVNAQKEIFIKQIEFKLDKISDIDYENEYFMTLKLNKGSKYVFKVANHVDNYIGEAVIELMDADVLILTNVFEEKYFENVSFQCNKTGFYDVLISFRDGKIGNSVVDILLVQ